MKILMTGATSFTGRHLVPMFKRSGFEVIQLVRDKQCSIIGRNDYIWDFYGPLPEGIPNCDVIVHLAAVVYFGNDMNIEQYNVNTVSTMRLADYAEKNNAYFTFASMAGIHGYALPDINADTEVCPNNHYGMSKYLAEQAIKTSVNRYSILRIGGIYGLDGPDHLGLNKSIHNAWYLKEPPILNGPGNAKRNYICVKDVAGWIVYIIQNRPKADNPISEVLYLAGDEYLTIKELLQMVANILTPGRQLRINEGKDSPDIIVKPSKPPFQLTSFNDYLHGLVQKD